MWLNHRLLTGSLVWGHSGCFQPAAIVSKAAANICGLCGDVCFPFSALVPRRGRETAGSAEKLVGSLRTDPLAPPSTPRQPCFRERLYRSTTRESGEGFGMLPFPVLAFSRPQRLNRAVRWFGTPGGGEGPLALPEDISLPLSTRQLTVEIQGAVLSRGGLEYLSLSRCFVG